MSCTNSIERMGARVTKPPGGGSSDIFGPAAAPETRRRTSNTTTSNIFAPAEKSSPSPQRQAQAKRQQEDTQNKLFGEPEPQAPPHQPEDNADGSPATRTTRVRQPPGGVSSKLW